MGIFSELFVWWKGNTIGQRLYTWRNGEFVGEDEFGNRYYKQAKGNGPLGVPRRWVVYTDLAEATLVSADWHGWLHHTEDEPPTASDYVPRPWQKGHRPNYTGSALAYRPQGSTLASGKRPSATGDYQAWKP